MFRADRNVARPEGLVSKHKGDSMSLSSAVNVEDGIELNYPAWLKTTNGLKDCLILRISGSGADIRLEGDKTAANEFDLWLTRNGTCRRRCELVEDHGDRLRVEFKREGPSFVVRRPEIMLL